MDSAFFALFYGDSFETKLVAAPHLALSGNAATGYLFPMQGTVKHLERCNTYAVDVYAPHDEKARWGFGLGFLED
jgi:hypothetical protein